MNLPDILLLGSQIAVLVLTAVILGKIAKLLGLPKVAGELSAGILLGSTCIGHFYPEFLNFFFPENSSTVTFREHIVQSGLLFFLLAAGMELQPEHLKKNAKVVASCSLLGLMIPFALGWMFVMYFPGLAGAGPDNQRFLAFFLGTALSISALPVIAKILIDLKLMQTRFGTLVMSAASVDDLAGWILFSALLTVFQGGSVTGAGIGFKIIFLSSIAAAALFFQKFTGRVFLKLKEFLTENIAIGLIMILTLLTAKGAELAGMHGVFGSFVLGVFLSGGARVWRAFHSKLLYAVSHFFAPLFFASIGLKINFALHFDSLLFFAIFTLACIGKLAGVTAGGRLSGLPLRESLALAFAMNARGAMGMVLAATALNYGMIPENLFTALVMMALGTSIMSAPAIRALLTPGSQLK